jgi:STE24 endopeptidase
MSLNLLNAISEPSGFRMLFLFLFCADVFLEWLLTFLNEREARRHSSLPAAFRGHFEEGDFTRSRAYTLERSRFARLSLFYSAALSLFILFSGVLPAAQALAGRLFGEGPFHGAAFLAGVMLLQSLLKLPFSIYSTFRIEGKYGFNTMTWGLYTRDLAKEFLLFLALGLPLLTGLLWVMAHAGPLWWLWAFLLILAFQLVMMVAYPLFIAPLFNRFKPLEEGSLKASLLEMAGALRFPAQGIYVMDGSRRSLHSNAYFTGFGRFRRIVLFDTLIRQMETPELRGVLAHEIGHYKLKHIYKMMAAQVLMLGALLYLMSLALPWTPLYRAFRFDGPSLAAGLFLFLTVFSTLSTLWAPLQNHFSRKHEYEADAFAVRAEKDKAAMMSALIKLSRKNLSNLTPHPWYSAFHYSHPTLGERLQAIEAV